MSTADKDGRILQALGDRLICLGMEINVSVTKQAARFDATLASVTKPTEYEETQP